MSGQKTLNSAVNQQPTAKGKAIADEAKKYLGNPYVYGAKGQAVCKKNKHLVEGWAKDHKGVGHYGHFLGKDVDAFGKNWAGEINKESTNYIMTDCSGLTKMVFDAMGISCPHGANNQASTFAKKKVSTANARVGDLLWKDKHVGIVGENGTVIEAYGWQRGVTNIGHVINNFTSAYHLSGDDTAEKTASPLTSKQLIDAGVYNNKNNADCCLEIQKALGIPETGVFDGETINYIAQWQKNVAKFTGTDVDGKFGQGGRNKLNELGISHNIPDLPGKTSTPKTTTNTQKEEPKKEAAAPETVPEVSSDSVLSNDNLGVDTTSDKLIYSSKVSTAFCERVKQMAIDLKMPAEGANWLMACMCFESGGTFSPSVKNKVSGATGLIQFMPSTAKNMGTTTDKLAAMSAEQQLEYVYNYFKGSAGNLNKLSDVYMRILWPAAMGKSEDYALFKKGTAAYTQNSGLDKNGDGIVTKAEAAAKVQQKYNAGTGTLDSASLSTALSWTQKKNYSATVIAQIRAAVGSAESGAINTNDIKAIAKWQASKGLDVDGKFGNGCLSKAKIKV